MRENRKVTREKKEILSTDREKGCLLWKLQLRTVNILRVVKMVGVNRHRNGGRFVYEVVVCSTQSLEFTLSLSVYEIVSNNLSAIVT